MEMFSFKTGTGEFLSVCEKRACNGMSSSGILRTSYSLLFVMYSAFYTMEGMLSLANLSLDPFHRKRCLLYQIVTIQIIVNMGTLLCTKDTNR